MKYIKIMMLLLFSSTIVANENNYVIDDSHFSIGFLVEHAGYAKTLGLFKQIEGKYTYDQSLNLVKDLVMTINTDSVFTNHDKRDAHLRSPDFLDVEKFPTMTFMVDEYDLSKTPGKLKGKFTLLGVTKDVVLDFNINKVAEYPFRVGLSKPIVMGVSARASLNRSDYGMSYGVDKNLVGDEIELIIEFEARQQ
tara:strand:+ start:843 stop:1424 length:582 start_codon:yes stop_codon:yes gene_type:complete